MANIVGNVRRDRSALITVQPLTFCLLGFLGNRACPTMLSPEISVPSAMSLNGLGGPPHQTWANETKFNVMRCFDGVFFIYLQQDIFLL